ncbi:MAG: SIMPL domain-containing protein [Candidatus Peribacteria bacterium]|nr:SIMPL domain-containing protein [Candidatus Peribacteria bacterium]
MQTTDRILRIIGVLVVCTVIVYTFKIAPTADNNGINVVGQGVVKVQPDTLTLNFNVQEKAETTKEAQQKIDDTSSAFITLITQLGVEKKSIQTTNYSVYPHYYRDNPTNKQISDGYTASQTMTITLKGSGFVELGEQVLSAAPTVGNITINGSSFSVTDKAPGEKEARSLALQHARAKAQQLADVEGVKLGRALQISETTSVGGYYPVYANAEVM